MDTSEGQLFGDIVKYSCSYGYYMVGDNKFVCGSDRLILLLTSICITYYEVFYSKFLI